MTANTTLMWFRRDLRLEDNPAYAAAIGRKAAVVPVFIWAPQEEGEWAPGAASRWWLHHSLAALQEDLQRLGSQLILRRGGTAEQLRWLVKETGAEAVYWNRLYEPEIVERDKALTTELREQGLDAQSFNGNLLFEPWEVQTQQGDPYQVFTPFWKACLRSNEPDEPVVVSGKPAKPDLWPDSVPLDALELEPTVDWTGGLRENWQSGTAGAGKRLDDFLRERIADYNGDRDRPDRVGTSRLSPHLHFGEISPRQIWRALQQRCSTDRRTREGKSVEKFQQELGWREFAHHVLFHFPQTPNKPLRAKFAKFPWSENHDVLTAWKNGRTGYPIVDAGMRELWTTGWMHNRVRMIVGSFLTKDVLHSWTEGARWFWDTLVDADLANNTLGWQWVAGCGADAAPYFRIFNPISQGEKFDPQGEYVRRWVPELKGLPKRWIHQPWCADSDVLSEAGVVLGETYPRPVVDHSEARQAALAAFDRIKSG